jgi:hypothetical protein
MKIQLHDISEGGGPEQSGPSCFRAVAATQQELFMGTVSEHWSAGGDKSDGENLNAQIVFRLAYIAVRATALQ